MVFRSTGFWKQMVNGLRGGRAPYTTSTSPKLKAYAPTADIAHHDQPVTGESVPVYVATGMIALSVGLGIYTAMQHLMYNPTVRVNKKRRETIPEVVEPERVVNEANRHINKSLFRKVAHVQAISKDAYAYRPHVETLESVGIDPKQL